MISSVISWFADLKGRPFKATLWLVIQFIILTVIAMLIYPGGTQTDPSSEGYSFWRNFFSELGMTVTESGASNPIGAVLFFAALTGAGMALILFFVAVLQFFLDAIEHGQKVA